MLHTKTATRSRTEAGQVEQTSGLIWKLTKLTSLEGYTMTLNAMIKNFAADESGAVTVDWVVLTAAIVGLGIAVMASVSDGLKDLSGDIETQLTTQGIKTTF